MYQSVCPTVLSLLVHIAVNMGVYFHRSICVFTFDKQLPEAYFRSRRTKFSLCICEKNHLIMSIVATDMGMYFHWRHMPLAFDTWLSEEYFRHTKFSTRLQKKLSDYKHLRCPCTLTSDTQLSEVYSIDMPRFLHICNLKKNHLIVSV